MAIRDDVKPSFLQRAWRQAAGYAMPGSALAGAASLVIGTAGVIAGVPALAVAGLAAGTASTAAFAGSVALGNRAHEAFRGSVRAMVRGNFQESERQASVADELGAVNGEPYQARSLAWRAAVGGVVLASVGVQAVASAAAAGSVTDVDLGAINSMSAGTKNAVYYQMDHDPASLDGDRLNQLAAKFTDTQNYNVQYVDSENWDLETGIPKLSQENQKWISGLKLVMDGSEHRVAMDVSPNLTAETGDYFHDSHSHIGDLLRASDGNLADKAHQFKNMSWEDKAAILDKTIDLANLEASSKDADSKSIGGAMTMLVLMTERSNDGLLNLNYPDDGFMRSQIPEDIQDDLSWSERRIGGEEGTNALDMPYENRAQDTLQQILLNLGVNESNPAVKNFIWDKYRDLHGHPVSSLGLDGVPPSSMNPTKWLAEASIEEGKTYFDPLEGQGMDGEDYSQTYKKELYQSMSNLSSEYFEMDTTSKLAVMNTLLEEGRNQVADSPYVEDGRAAASNILLALSHKPVDGYNDTPKDIEDFRLSLQFGEIKPPFEKTWQHQQFSEAVNYMALTESDPVVEKFLWDQVRDISGLDTHLELHSQKGQNSEYHESSLERGTISNEFVGADIEHTHSFKAQNSLSSEIPAPTHSDLDLEKVKKQSGSEGIQDVFATNDDTQESDSLKELRDQGAGASEYLKASFDLHKSEAKPLEGELSEAVASNKVCVKRKNRNQSDSIWNTDIRYRSDRAGAGGSGTDPYAGMTWREKQQARRDAKAAQQASGGAERKAVYDFQSGKGGQKLCIDNYLPLEKGGEFMEDIINFPGTLFQSSLDSDGSSHTAFLATPKPEAKSAPVQSTQSDLQSEFDRLSASRDKGQTSERFHQNGGIGLQAAASEPVQKDTPTTKAPMKQAIKKSTGRA